MSIVDEFKVVTRRRKSNKVFRGVHRLTSTRKEEREDNPDVDIEKVERGIKSAVEFIEDSSYRRILIQGLDEGLTLIKVANLSEIICYGLGNFSQFRASKFQLGAILTLKQHYGCEVHIYDPLFFNSEIEILKNLGFKVIQTNEEAKRKVHNTGSLVYMPHCPYQLTNNFIYANWSAENLSNCLILANSFNDLGDSISLKNLTDTTNYIARIHPYTTEITLANNFEYEEVFNGSSIHVFEKKNLDKVPKDFWDCCESPIYLAESCDFLKRSESPIEET